MGKKFLFVSIVVLGMASVASAGIWHWVFSFPWTQSTPSSQTQGFYGSAGQVAVNVGPGSTSGTNSINYNNTQTGTTPSGNTMTQSTNVAGTQETSIAGSSGSVGLSYQTVTVTTNQKQSW